MRKHAVVFCGGHGARRLIGALAELRMDITCCVNAYDNGFSTGVVRRALGILGPSDIRKNIECLVDRGADGAGAVLDFLSLRFPARPCMDAWDVRMGPALEKTPEGFRAMVREGVRLFLDAVCAAGRTIECRDFSPANAVLAGYAVDRGGMQAATDEFSAAVPMRGRVLVNSDRVVHLYAVREARDGDGSDLVVDEAGLVAAPSRARVRSFFLLPEALSGEELAALRAMTPASAHERLAGRAARRIPPLPRSLEAIRGADLVVYPPGSQFSSVWPTLVTDGFADAIAGNAKARKVLLTNILEDRDSAGWTAADIVAGTLEALGRRASEAREPGAYLTDVFVNDPAVQQPGVLAPGIAGFRGEAGFTVRQAAGTDALPGAGETAGRVAVTVVPLEDRRERGLHSAAGLAGVFASVARGLEGTAVRLRCLTRGAILFDIDETLLDVRIDGFSGARYEETLMDSPTRSSLLELLGRGMRIGVFSGNGMANIRARFLDPLTGELRRVGRLAELTNLDVYADGASTHVGFSADGSPVEDAAYGSRFHLPQCLFEEASAVVAELGAEGSGLRLPGPGELGRTVDLNLWRYAYRGGRWVDGDGESPRGIPWLEVRGPSMATVKPLPSERHALEGSGMPLRDRWLRAIHAALRKRLPDLYPRLSIRRGGWSSIDIVSADLDKATAVKHYLESRGLRPQEALYFGNEFSTGGNDLPVAERIRGITVVSVEKPGRPPAGRRDVFRGGRLGTRSTLRHLDDILEDLQLASESAGGGRNEVPVIQRKIRRLLEEETASCLRTVEDVAGPEERNGLLRDLLRVHEGWLRRKRGRVACILPAAGRGSRFHGSRPKFLAEAEGGTALEGAIDAFAPYASVFYVVAASEHERALKAVTDRRPEDIVVVRNDGHAGEGAAVLDVLERFRIPESVLVAWPDTLRWSARTVREAFEAHSGNECALTFPTRYCARPYVRIARDAEGRPVRAEFQAPGGGFLEPGEQDCSFFLGDAAEIRCGLRRIADSGREGELKFLFLLADLYGMGKDVAALPIAGPADFLGFNTVEEWEALRAV